MQKEAKRIYFCGLLKLLNASFRLLLFFADDNTWQRLAKPFTPRPALNRTESTNTAKATARALLVIWPALDTAPSKM